MTEPASDLTASIIAFCAVLRTEYGFSVGSAEAHDALRALETVGVSNRGRVRTALRLVCCGTQPQTRAFDRAFDAFFVNVREGVPQPAYAPRNTRPGDEKADISDDKRRSAKPANADDQSDESNNGGHTSTQRRPLSDEPDSATAWQLLHARYSPTAARGLALEVDSMLATRMRPIAERLIHHVALGRSRRWKAMLRGGRFDMRRTIRASLATAGDPLVLRFIGHPLRNPRFVVLIDGSRSMTEHTQAIVAFAAALCDRTARAHVFVFSTGLRDVTRELRTGVRGGANLADLGDAWGGGTKIGASLATFVAEQGRSLSLETLVVIFSDGLDVGDVPQLERALREIDRRSAGVVWLNPHAASSGYVPAARGMRAALPFITLLAAANDVHGFEELATRIMQTPRIRGRRR